MLPSMPIAGQTAKIIRSTSKALALLIVGGIFGGIGTYLWRDHQLTSNSMTFRQVKVVRKVTDKRYFMQPAGMKAYDWEFCHAITPPAAVVDIKFEQRNGCKQIIGVGFLEISAQENSNVQIGRNPTTATEASAAF